jgi:hypothetical protein
MVCNPQDRRHGDRSLESIKHVLFRFRPSPDGVLASELMEWAGDGREPLDESSVLVQCAEEGLDLLYLLWLSLPVDNRQNLLWVHLDFALFYN